MLAPSSKAFGGVEGERGKLLHLPFQQFALAHRRLDILLRRLARVARGAPGAIGCGYLTGQALGAGMGIEQVALRIATQERVMGVLAVNVGKEIGCFAQLPQGSRGTVDVGTGATGAVDHAAQQAGIGIVVVGPQPGFQRPLRRDVELRRNLRTLGTAAYHRRIRPLAQR